jgi:hypothetical protein
MHSMLRKQIHRFLLNDRTRVDAATAALWCHQNPYTLTSSAHMQNLGRDLHHHQDRRWRIGELPAAAFQWESGQDLSAVTLVIADSNPTNRHEKKASQCTCSRREKKREGSGVEYRYRQEQRKKPVSPLKQPLLMIIYEESGARTSNVLIILFERDLVSDSTTVLVLLPQKRSLFLLNSLHKNKKRLLRKNHRTRRSETFLTVYD